MSMKDTKNRQIDMLKYWLGILVASFLGIGAYLVTHIETLQNWLLLLSCFALICLLVAIVVVNQRINRLINDLKDLWCCKILPLLSWRLAFSCWRRWRLKALLIALKATNKWKMLDFRYGAWAFNVKLRSWNPHKFTL